MSEPEQIAAAALDVLRARAETVVTAESLTAGLICSTLASIPGASDCLRGGIAAYATDVKSSVLGVDDALIERHGVVSAECAVAMAQCARRLFDSDWAMSATGVAGPTEQDGRAVGTVFVAVAGPSARSTVRALELTGDRASIRQQSSDAALSLLAECLADGSSGGVGPT